MSPMALIAYTHSADHSLLSSRLNTYAVISPSSTPYVRAIILPNVPIIQEDEVTPPRINNSIARRAIIILAYLAVLLIVAGYFGPYFGIELLNLFLYFGLLLFVGLAIIVQKTKWFR